jgi:ribosomal protein S18 acetylase RimI-like enzyme
MPIEIRPIRDADLPALTALLQARHAAHRKAEPLLAGADAAAELERLLGGDAVTGVVAARGREPVAYLAGEVRTNSVWGTHAWVDYAGHGSTDPELIRDLYAAIAPAWLEAGARLHLALVPAPAGMIDPWYRLGFAQMQMNAMRPSGAEPVAPPEGIAIRFGGPDDLERVAEFQGRLIWEQQALSPTFTGLEPPPWETLLADWQETFIDPSDTLFLAERDGELVGHSLLYRPDPALGTPADAIRLATIAVVPHQRGRGIGLALSLQAISWAAGAGYPAITVDWRVANLLASRFWPARGFRPTFLRMSRMTGIG